MALKNINIDWGQSGSRPNKQYDPTALVDGVQLATDGAMLLALVVTNTGAADTYVQVHDAATAPADAAVPSLSLGVAAGATVSLTLPVALSNGCYVCNSSTAGTKTIGAAELLVWAQLND